MQLPNTDRLFAVALALLLCAVALYAKRAIGGDWSRSGNDMEFLLPALERDAPTQYLIGPWAGREIFEYYRPVTSLAMWLELRSFGQAPSGWQAISLLLHLASVAILALLLSLAGARAGAIAGAGMWGFRDRIVETIEWVPAQTDLFAGFFAIACLWCVARSALGGTRWWYVAAVATGLLAAGSKETALVLVGLCPIVAWMANPNQRSQALRVGLFSIGTLILFLGARFAALGGFGFLPGHAVGQGTEAVITIGSVARRLAHFLLPYPLGPIGSINLGATWAVCLGTATAWILRARPFWALLAFLSGLAVAIFFLGDVSWLLLPSTWAHFIWAVLAFAALAMAAVVEPVKGVAVLAFGVCAALPLYHVVYNTAGNVTYLPDIYQALLWAWVITSLLRVARGMEH